MPRVEPAKTFTETILRLQAFWADYGCVIAQPGDNEKGAGTFNANTFLRALGPEPWKVAYVEPSRRPTDGRYGDNPNRLYKHHQYQVVLKPSPKDVQSLYLDSMAVLGIHPADHDIRFVEDNWESPTLGAWGLGWEVWVDGMELTQFTYFQQVGGLECRPVSAELTYGLERIAMYLQNVDNVYDLAYAPGVSYREIHHQDEVEYSKFSFEALDVPLYKSLFESFEKECERLAEQALVVPAYDHLLKASHAFNSLDARGAISVTERQGYILRVRALAKRCAEAYAQQREALAFPMGRVASTPSPEPQADGAPPRDGTAALLIEIGSEEIPAAEVEVAVSSLRDQLVAALEANRLAHGDVRTWCTPRRLTVAVDAVQAMQDNLTKEVMGPPVKVAFRDGVATKAAEGFAKGLGLTVDQLDRKETKKGEYLCAMVKEEGQSAAELLAPLLPEMLSKIPFKKTMRWGAGDAAFIRPIQWILALLGDAVLPFAYADVASGRTSCGHRFLAPEPFEVRGVEQYLEEIAKRDVVIDAAERRRQISSGASELAATVDGQLSDDAELIEEVVQLVERPVAMLCEFDSSYLEIPQEVLISEMREHQRYLPLVDGAGKLMPYFVVIANTPVTDEAVVKGGYLRVLTARFADGAFFYAEDQKRKLVERVGELEKVQFHRALGSVHAKVARSVSMATWLAVQLGKIDEAPADTFALATGEGNGFARDLVRAGWLMKTDLVTRMVYEFPDLQGTMGRAYAGIDGEGDAVATAIESHYKPRNAGDDLPSDDLGALLGIADRLDSIAGIFSVAKGPTGTADPFGLRRAALAIINILRDRGWHLSIDAAIARAVEGIGDKRKKDADVAEREIREFFRGRLRGVLTGGDVPSDVAEAVLVASYDDMVDAADRAHALAALRSRPEFEPIAVAFKRVANILKGQTPAAPDPSSLDEGPERALYEATQKVADSVRGAVEARDFDGAFGTIADLRPSVDAFFDAVMVMDEDAAVRARRVAIVGAVHKIFAPLADFTRLS